jgi:hypothetical protein
VAKDIRCRALRHVGASFAGDGHLAGLARMLLLLMASALRHQLPTIVFEQSNELAELHSAHRAEALGWAMSRRVR